MAGLRLLCKIEVRQCNPAKDLLASGSIMRKKVIVILFGMFIFPALLYADDTASLLKKVREYGQEVSRIEASAKTASLEKLLQQGDAIAVDLQSIIEQLSNADYDYVVKNMKGFIVNREEAIVLKPDSNFFSKLGRKVGTEQDRLYFGFVLKVKPEGYWPVYLDRQTDLGGCTKYGDGTLSSLYKEGSMLSPRVGGYYGKQLDKMLDEMGDAFTSGSCACGDVQSVIAEFQTFMETNPNAAIAYKVNERLRSIKQGSSHVRFHCVGGV